MACYRQASLYVFDLYSHGCDNQFRTVHSVASLMSPMASLVTTIRMQQCFNVLIDIYHEFLLLFYCYVLLEIKLTTATTHTTTFCQLAVCCAG